MTTCLANSEAASIIAVEMHAVRRAMERYGTSVTHAAMYDHIAVILAGESALVERQADGRERRRFVWQGRKFRVVWCPRLRRIVTYLPPRGAKGYRW